MRIFRENRIVARELCESEEQAKPLVERYADERGMTFEIEDLGRERRPGEILASPSIGFDEDYEADGLARARAGRRAVMRTPTMSEARRRTAEEALEALGSRPAGP